MGQVVLGSRPRAAPLRLAANGIQGTVSTLAHEKRQVPQEFQGRSCTACTVPVKFAGVTTLDWRWLASRPCGTRLSCLSGLFVGGQLTAVASLRCPCSGPNTAQHSSTWHLMVASGRQLSPRTRKPYLPEPTPPGVGSSSLAQQKPLLLRCPWPLCWQPRPKSVRSTDQYITSCLAVLVVQPRNPHSISALYCPSPTNSPGTGFEANQWTLWEPCY
jgi:hypothetical protein